MSRSCAWAQYFGVIVIWWCWKQWIVLFNVQENGSGICVSLEDRTWLAIFFHLIFSWSNHLFYIVFFFYFLQRFCMRRRRFAFGFCDCFLHCCSPYFVLFFSFCCVICVSERQEKPPFYAIKCSWRRQIRQIVQPLNLGRIVVFFYDYNNAMLLRSEDIAERNKIQLLCFEAHQG